MTNPKENIKESPVSQPAGEAPGSDLPPEGQGGPHLPDISEPTSKSLSEQFESGPDPVELAKGSEAEQPAEETVEAPDPFGGGPIDRPVEQPHKCFVCESPNHHACGCEARERILSKQSIPAVGGQAGSRMDLELDREDANAKKMLEDVFGKDMEKELIQMAGKMSGVLLGGVDKFEEFKSGVLDGLRDINSNLETLVKLEQDRADLMKDIKNAYRN